MTEDEWNELDRKIRPIWDKWQLVIVFVVCPIVVLAITWVTRGRPF
jgi:hypothetical protein